MGTECVATMLNSDTDPAIPPGFGPFVSSSNSACNDSVSSSGNEITRKSRRNRRTVGYNELDTCSDEDYTHKNVLPSARKLPKGVIRGCAQCLNCQKVVARWKPENACRPVLDEAPVFYPTEEEFKDTLKYIETIRPHAEPYGIGRIVPPWTWRPPCVLKDKCIWGTSQFATRVQRLDKLQNRESSKNICEDQTSTATTSSKRRKVMGNETGQNGSNSNVVERFGFEPGPDFTLEMFSKFADDFKTQYFGLDTNEGFEPSVENIEGEYWRIVENPSSEIEVLYGADLETKSFGSGFPKQKDSIANSSEMEDEYVKSGWNLNNFARLPGSVLSFESGEISGVLIPWLYVGMCFSSFCWHVEDHHLYSLNYNHWGAPKIWYGVPGYDASKLETAMRKHLPDLFEEQPDLLHNLVTQFSPALLKQEGIPVYRCVQREGEFVITFPRAYHAGFNCGFNCAEAVNVAPVDWLPHGQYAVELYREQGRKISVSHDKMLLGAAREAVRAQWEIAFLKNNSDVNLRWKNSCGPTTILSRTLKARIGVERERRGNLCNTSQPKKMDSNFDSTDRECAICHYDLHLSAACCPCDVDRYGCLLHAKELCKCDWSTRVFLYRYDITELDVLCDAVSGKLSAVHRWALSDLRLSLRSCLAKKEEVKKESGKDESKNTKIVVSSKEEKKEVLLEPCSKKDEIENVILPQNQSSNLEDNNKKDNNEIVNLPSLEREISVVVALSCTHDVKPRQNKNKGGPRVANVVRKFSCSVEVLEYGTVVSRKNWCTSQTIFPKGYRSRVKYRSVIDPTQMCFYISEIIDGGDSGPLFMARVEESRDEAFIHVSAIKCWEMVREKLILEMRRQNIKGKNELPPLPPPGSIDGLEMFGLTSPHILKEIEALDQDRVCDEYWNSRPNNNIQQTRTERNPNLVVFKGLLQKAGPEEIEAVREILSGDVASVTRQEAVLLVNKESERFHLK